MEGRRGPLRGWLGRRGVAPEQALVFGQAVVRGPKGSGAGHDGIDGALELHGQGELIYGFAAVSELETHGAVRGVGGLDRGLELAAGEGRAAVRAAVLFLDCGGPGRGELDRFAFHHSFQAHGGGKLGPASDGCEGRGGRRGRVFAAVLQWEIGGGRLDIDLGRERVGADGDAAAAKGELSLGLVRRGLGGEGRQSEGYRQGCRMNVGRVVNPPGKSRVANPAYDAVAHGVRPLHGVIMPVSHIHSFSTCRARKTRKSW